MAPRAPAQLGRFANTGPLAARPSVGSCQYLDNIVVYTHLAG